MLFRSMIDIVVEYLKNEKTGIEKVYFILFDMETYKVFNDYLRKVALLVQIGIWS